MSDWDEGSWFSRTRRTVVSSAVRSGFLVEEEMSVFSGKEEILEGNAGGGKTEKIRELVRKRAPRHIWLVDGKWEPANQRVLQLASAATLDVKYIREDLAAQDLLYKLARHIRNTDEIHPATWGAQGLELLAQLREIDPERYDKEVK